MGRVLHASYSGYFPFCLNEIPESYRSAFSNISTTSLENAMRIFWRIKKFRIYGRFAETSTEEIKDWEMVVESTANEERDIVCFRGEENWKVVSYLNLLAGGEGPNIFGPRFIFSYPIYTLNKEYVVQLIIDGYFSGTQGPGGFVYRNPSYFVNFDRTFNFEGVTLYGFNAGLEMKYEILEYWSYDGTWNTKTGAKL